MVDWQGSSFIRGGFALESMTFGSGLNFGRSHNFKGWTFTNAKVIFDFLNKNEKLHDNENLRCHLTPVTLLINQNTFSRSQRYPDLSGSNPVFNNTGMH